MTNLDLGQGIRIESLDVKPSFPFGVGRAALQIPDPIFPDIKGTLSVSSGPNTAARTVGQTAMGATASFIVRGSNCAVGFKQLAAFKSSSATYAGLKSSDGSITEASTGLNFRTFLDCSPTEQLTVPWAPFYLPKAFVRSGAQVSIEMPDQPRGRFRLQRRNSLRDRLNFLLSVATRCDFITFVVVVLPNGEHVPTEGFSWSYSHEVEMHWKNGNPSIARDTSHISFDSKLSGLPPTDPRMLMLANSALGSGDTIVVQFNKALTAASRGQRSANYVIEEDDHYTFDVEATMKNRFENAFF